MSPEIRSLNTQVADEQREWHAMIDALVTPLPADFVAQGWRRLMLSVELRRAELKRSSAPTYH